MVITAVEPQMRDRILQAATDLLSHLPLTKVTMEDIARSAGIARQTIYKHFASKDELIVALFVHEMTATHHPALRKISRRPPTPSRLVEMFVTELELALRYVVLSTTFDPSIAPRIGELVLSSAELNACRESVWIPILVDYREHGILRPELDLHQAVRWMTYQHVWFLSHPDALTPDPVERREYIATFIVGALVWDDQVSAPTSLTSATSPATAISSHTARTAKE